MTHTTYNIVTAGIGHRVIEADVLPTPRLIDEGTRGPVQAYRESGPETGHQTSVWRVRDDSYDRPGTKYTTVMVDVVRS